MALDDLHRLHEGNVARYRLRLSEYRAWQPMQNAEPPNDAVPPTPTFIERIDEEGYC